MRIFKFKTLLLRDNTYHIYAFDKLIATAYYKNLKWMVNVSHNHSLDIDELDFIKTFLDTLPNTCDVESISEVIISVDGCKFSVLKSIKNQHILFSDKFDPSKIYQKFSEFGHHIIQIKLQYDINNNEYDIIMLNNLGKLK